MTLDMSTFRISGRKTGGRRRDRQVITTEVIENPDNFGINGGGEKKNVSRARSCSVKSTED